LSDSTTRRGAIKKLVEAAAATAFPIYGQNPPPESHHSPAPVTKQAASAYKFQYFSADQLRTLDALTETIIPADDHSLGAEAAAVSEYIDAIVADGPKTTQQFWDGGIFLVNKLAQGSFGKFYEDCSAEEQIAIMSELAGNEDDLSSPEHRFYAALKRATIDGYYTSKIGIHQELQYQGNEALGEFPGCQHTEQA